MMLGLSVALAAAALAGCSRSSLPPPPPRPPLTRIDVVPVLPPTQFHARNANPLLIGALPTLVADQVRKGYFGEKLEAERKSMGPKLTAALVAQLRQAGYEPQVLDGATRDPSDPESIDYAKLPGSAPVLHVYYSDAGMYSSQFSLYYVPRLNISASLVGRGGDDAYYEETIYYGADARGEASWSVPSPERFRFVDFQALLNQVPEVLASYDHGIVALARRVARNIKEQY